MAESFNESVRENVAQEVCGLGALLSQPQEGRSSTKKNPSSSEGAGVPSEPKQGAATKDEGTKSASETAKKVESKLSFPQQPNLMTTFAPNDFGGLLDRPSRSEPSFYSKRDFSRDDKSVDALLAADPSGAQTIDFLKNRKPSATSPIDELDYEVGIAYEKTGNPDEAVRYYKLAAEHCTQPCDHKAARMTPEPDPAVHHNKAYYLIRAAELDYFRGNYRESVPTFSEATENFEKFRKLRPDQVGDKQKLSWASDYLMYLDACAKSGRNDHERTTKILRNSFKLMQETER